LSNISTKISLANSRVCVLEGFGSPNGNLAVGTIADVIHENAVAKILGKEFSYYCYSNLNKRFTTGWTLKKYTRTAWAN
jgi:hypothetical protein